MKTRVENQNHRSRTIAQFFTSDIDSPVLRDVSRIFFKLVHYALVVALAWLSYLAINQHVLSTVRVSGMSMRPTLKDSDVFLLHRWVYLLTAPKPGDIVVIKDPGDDGFSIKRIIARPGDFICLRQGSVYLNGKKLDEPYLQPDTQTLLNYNSSAQWMIGCQADQYIVLGDNRNNSLDSRSYGTVSRDRILGAVFL